MPLFRSARPGPQTDVDPHYWKLPTSYSTSKPKDKPTVIPHPSIFSNAAIPTVADTNDVESILIYPDASHAAVHLALLDCFRKLWQSAEALDVEVDLPPEYNEKQTSTTAAASGPVRLPETKRWDLLIRLAITRFGVWWSKIRLVFTHASAYANHAGSKAQIQLTEGYLPPLDVLLVWYALMLDSDAYATTCQAMEDEVPGISNLCFPWMAIRKSIDMETMTFHLSKSAQNLFSTLSGQSADILTYLEGPPAYSEEPSYSFPIDLFDEVKKHETFIEEAYCTLWIRSPALRGSLGRWGAEYVKFQLAGPASATSAMGFSWPPFGVRLFWRTHRLYPRLYAAFLRETGEYEEEGAGNTAKMDTPKKPKVSQEQPCGCWTCERIRDELPQFTHSPAPYTAGTSSSSHPSSSSTKQQLSSLPKDVLWQIQDDLGFYYAVKKARELGKELPRRPPTRAELEAERVAKERQDKVGYLPGINEYVEIQPDGTRKIRRAKYANAWKGLGWAT